MNRESEAKKWAKNYAQEVFHGHSYDDNQQRPKEFPISSRELFNELDKSGNDTRHFNVVKMLCVGEWTRLRVQDERRREDMKLAHELFMEADDEYRMEAENEFLVETSNYSDDGY